MTLPKPRPWALVKADLAKVRAKQARADGLGITPQFETLKKPDGPDVHRLMAMEVETSVVSPVAERVPGEARRLGGRVHSPHRGGWSHGAVGVQAAGWADGDREGGLDGRVRAVRQSSGGVNC